MTVNEDTIILVVMNQDGKVHPMWYDTLGNLFDHEFPDCSREAVTQELEDYGRIELYGNKASISYDLSVVTEVNAGLRVWCDGPSYWSHRTPITIFPRLESLGVPRRRYCAEM